MREPTLEGKPFSLCDADELSKNILSPLAHVKSFDDEGTSLEYAMDIARRYAAKLVNGQ